MWWFELTRVPMKSWGWLTLDKWKAALKIPALKMCHVTHMTVAFATGTRVNWRRVGKGITGRPRSASNKQPHLERVRPGPAPWPRRPSWPSTTVRQDPSGRPLDGGRHYCRGAATNLRRPQTPSGGSSVAGPTGRTVGLRRLYCSGRRLRTQTDANRRYHAAILGALLAHTKGGEQASQEICGLYSHRSSPISSLNSSPWVGVPHPLPM